MNKIPVILGSVLLAATILGGCSEKSVTPTQKKTEYRVEGVLVKDLSNGSARIDLTLTKNSVAYNKAVITLGSTVLDTNTYGYVMIFSPSDIIVGQDYNLNIHDSTALNTDLTISLPGSFADTVTIPANRVYVSGDVHVSWGTAAGADGYILATVPPPGAITDSGYTAYYTTVGNQVITPDGVFTYNGDPVSGTHKVYVAAFNGAPVKTLGFPFLVPTVNSPVDNVVSQILGGRLAGMVIPAPDSVIVPTP
jgi:hypothetical protein